MWSESKHSVTFEKTTTLYRHQLSPSPGHMLFFSKRCSSSFFSAITFLPKGYNAHFSLNIWVYKAAFYRIRPSIHLGHSCLIGLVGSVQGHRYVPTPAIWKAFRWQCKEWLQGGPLSYGYFCSCVMKLSLTTTLLGYVKRSFCRTFSPLSSCLSLTSFFFLGYCLWQLG